MKKLIIILSLCLVGLITAYAGINYGEYFPNGSTTLQSQSNGWAIGTGWISKDILTPEGCKEITSTWTNILFTPTRTLAEWLSFKTNPPPNIGIDTCKCRLDAMLDCALVESFANGACNNATQFACLTWTSSGNLAGSCGGSSTWSCLGSGGGTSVTNCTKANAACSVDWVCNNATKFACTTGTSISNEAGTYGGNATWICQWSNWGASPSCSKSNGCYPYNGTSCSILGEITAYGLNQIHPQCLSPMWINWCDWSNPTNGTCSCWYWTTWTFQCDGSCQ